MAKFIENVYKVIAYHMPETRLEWLVDRLITTNHLTELPHKYPIKEFIYLTEAFDPLQLTKERKISQEIFRNLWNTIYKFLSQNERDMINMYKTYGTLASFPYDVDEHRLTSLYNHLDDENCFTINTDYGNLKFEFAEREKYNVGFDTVLAYDDEENKVIIFVKKGDEITNIDIINIFIEHEGKFLHELQHYIDKMTDALADKNYEDDNPIAYLNDKSEFKANTQRIIGSFGRFLFKNQHNFKLEDLKNKNNVDSLFKIFIGQIENKRFNNVINTDTQEVFRKSIYYLYPENKTEFYNQLYKYTCDYYNSNDDMDLNEGRKRELIRLFRLEENYIKLF